MKIFFKLCNLFIITFVLSLCVACDDGSIDTNIDDNQDVEQKDDIKDIDILFNGSSNYDFIYSYDASDNIKIASKTLIDNINEKCNSNFKCYRDNAPREDGKFEVLIGLTNREESISIYNTLKPRSYKIAIVNNCLVIVGVDDTFTSLGIIEFERKVLEDSNKCANGKLTVSIDDQTEVVREEPFSVKEMIDFGCKPTVELEKVLRVEKTDKYFITQAGCCDGTYIYINFKPRADNEIKILKYDMNYNLVSESEDLPVGHANGMTYNSKTNELVICDCNDKTIFYTVDASTLKYKEKIQVTEGGGGGGITYSETRDLYAVNNGGEVVNIYDTSFNLVRSFKRENLKYTNQDCGSDEDLIYFDLSMAGTNNKIDIYDWDGLYYATITVKNTVESESVFSYNGKYWMLFYESMNGFTLYELKFNFTY